MDSREGEVESSAIEIKLDALGFGWDDKQRYDTSPLHDETMLLQHTSRGPSCALDTSCNNA